MAPRALSDLDEAELVDKLGRDVIATLGPGHLEVVRAAARHHRQFTDERAGYFEIVVGEVQQHFHDCFIDTSWPACPAHPRHPMWYAGGWWVVDGQPFARLGELESARKLRTT